MEVDILDVASHADAVHGFGIARTLRDHHGGNLIAHGTLYKALGRLEAHGLLVRWWEPAETAESERRPRRRLYRITDAGRAALLAASVEPTPTQPTPTVRPSHGLPGTVTP